MSVSRCLGPAIKRLSGVPRDGWRAEIEQLPIACPHQDCTVKGGCREYVAAYFRVQWQLAKKQANRAKRQPAPSAEGI